MNALDKDKACNTRQGLEWSNQPMTGINVIINLVNHILNTIKVAWGFIRDLLNQTLISQKSEVHRAAQFGRIVYYPKQTLIGLKFCRLLLNGPRYNSYFSSELVLLAYRASRLVEFHGPSIQWASSGFHVLGYTTNLMGLGRGLCWA